MNIHTRFIAIVSLLILSTTPVLALAFHADLSSIHATAAPGEIVNRAFSLTLAANEKKTRFRLYAQDFWRNEDGNEAFYRDPGTLTHSCGKWIVVNPVETDVEPGGKLDARISIVVPADAAPGGYWCVLTVDQERDPLLITPKGVGVVCLASLSIGIFVNVGDVHPAAKITGVQIDASKVSVQVANSGDCPLTADGRVEFYSTVDKSLAATVPLNRRTVFCEPIATSVLTSMLPDNTVLPAGRYLVRALVDIGIDHYLGAQKEFDVQRDTADKPASSP